MKMGQGAGLKQVLHAMCVLAFITGVVLFLPHSFAQSVTDAEQKSALILAFTEYFSWDKSGNAEEFRIGVTSGGGEILDLLTEQASGRAVYGRPIVVELLENTNTYFSADLLFVGARDVSKMQDIYTITSQSNTLLVSDNAQDPVFIMVNLVTASDQNVTFQINRPNINFEGIGIRDNIVMLGGSELEIAQLFRQMEQEIVRARLQLDTIESNAGELARTIEAQQHTIRSQGREIERQVEFVALRNGELNEIQENYELIESELITSNENLASRNQDLSELQANILVLNNQINAQSQQYLENNTRIEEQGILISEQGQRVDEQTLLLGIQEEMLTGQGQIIRDYRYLIRIIVTVSALILILLFVILLMNRKKKQAYSMLEQQKFELEQSRMHIVEEKARADHANELKTQFLANLSHEIRSPMNAILGYSELLESEFEAAQEGSKAINGIRQSGNHLLRIINDVLNMSKISSGKVSIRNVDFDLYKLVDDVELMIRPTSDKAGLLMVANIEPDVPRFIYSDAKPRPGGLPAMTR